MKALKTLAVLALAFGLTASAQTKARLIPKAAASPAGTAYSTIETTWQYAPTAPNCPANGTPTNCIAGFNLTISLGGQTVFTQTAGQAAGQLGPTALLSDYTPTGGISFGTYTITVETVGYDGNGNQLTSAPVSKTLAVNLTSINPPTNVQSVGK